MKACGSKDCAWYGKRYGDGFCGKCGQTMKELVKCCNRESLEDSGYCTYCGKKKEIRWKD